MKGNFMALNYKYKISRECLDDALEAGLSQAEIARMCNCSRQAINTRVHYKYKYKNSREYAIELLKLGWNPENVRVAVGYKCRQTVYDISRELGIKHKRGPKPK